MKRHGKMVQLPLPMTRDDRAVMRKAAHLPKRGRPLKKGAENHRKRPALKDKSVLHVTLKLKHGLPRLRGRKPAVCIGAAFRKYAHGDGFRLVHFSVQHDHIHLLLEADSKPRLSNAMQKLNISIANRLNILWGEGKRRTGRVFKERYNAHLLRTPTEVRNALVYVMHNGAKHGTSARGATDPFSSASTFNNYETPPLLITKPMVDTSRLAKAKSWLLTKGWMRARDGRIDPQELPRETAQRPGRRPP